MSSGAQQPSGGVPGGFQPSSPEQLALQAVMESCPGKTVISAVGGFALGGAFGLFMSSANWQGTSEEYLKLSGKEQFKLTMREMGSKTFSSAKNFGKVGGIYAATECLVENFRAKNDIWNGVSAGCLTGAALAASSGPQAMAVGCAGFAAFSGAIEYWMRNSD